MAFPGTCCSRLHRINGGKLWKQFCSPLGQTPVKEARWDWVTSKTRRDMAMESLKLRILHISILYEVWINQRQIFLAQQLWRASNPPGWGTRGRMMRLVSSSDGLTQVLQRESGLNGNCRDGTVISWLRFGVTTAFLLLFNSSSIPYAPWKLFMTPFYLLQTAPWTKLYWGIWICWLQCKGGKMS